VGDIQDRATRFELTPTHRDNFGWIVAALARFNAPRTITASPVRAGDEHGLNPFGRTTRQNATGSGGLVIRMRVDRHQRQGPISHELTLRTPGIIW
jgi:hypothetical protein